MSKPKAPCQPIPGAGVVLVTWRDTRRGQFGGALYVALIGAFPETLAGLSAEASAPSTKPCPALLVVRTIHCA